MNPSLRFTHLRAPWIAIAALAATCGACGGPGARDAGPGPDSATGADSGPVSDSGPGPATGLCPLSTHACDPAATARPSRRSEIAAVYDEGGHQLAVHGGSTAISIMCSIPAPEFSDETWLYDDECGSWRVLAAAGPGPRARHMAAYDSTARRMLVFGGRYRAGASGAYTLFADLWALDFATETWMMLDAGGAGAPGARSSGAVAFDAAGGRLWLFGGNASTSGASYAPLEDTWYYDLTGGSWTLASAGAPAPAPSPRLLLAGTFDPVRGRFVVFSGADASAFSAAPIYWSDLWAFDTTTLTWSLLDAGTGAVAPDGRFFGAMAYDGVNDGYLLFAGHDDTALGNTNDLWRYDPAAGAWTLLRRGDTFNEPFAGFCDPTVNFTVVDVAAPERRNAHGFVASTVCGHALALGGKTDCGAADDVWAYDLEGGAAPGWANPVEATEGEACLRRMDGDPTNCQTLCL